MTTRELAKLVITTHIKLDLNDPKGGDPDEWPEDLRVREFPASKVVAS